MSIDSGQLSKIVGIYKPARGKTEGGSPTITMGAAVQRWAEVELAGVGDNSIAGQTVGKNSGVIRCRWEQDFQDADTDWRIEYRGRMYEVTSVVNVGESNELIEFGVTQVHEETAT